MNRIKVSVITPTYHQAKYLKRCLERLAQQKRKPDEVIIAIKDTYEILQKTTYVTTNRSWKILNIKIASVNILIDVVNDIKRSLS